MQQKKLTGTKRRAFEAQVTLDYFDAKAYMAEQAIDWDRKTIALGLNELRTGIVCVDNFKARGNKKTEVKNPQMEVDIVALAEPQSQTDPKFQTLFKYRCVPINLYSQDANYFSAGEAYSFHMGITQRLQASYHKEFKHIIDELPLDIDRVKSISRRLNLASQDLNNVCGS